MTSSPPRKRSRRSHGVYTDPRFLIGVSLIITSVVLSAWIINRASGGEELYRLNTDIAQGQTIHTAQLIPVQARTTSDVYVRVGELSEPAIATQSLHQGELLPVAAVTTQAERGRRQIVIDVATRIPSSVGIGDTVEVWAVKEESLSNDTASKPTVLTTKAIVLKMIEREAGLSIERGQSVEISVPEIDLAALLTATGAHVRLVIVPVG
ncbi:MAG: hypothetical protein Q4P71_00810 [Actinomycetaceae bacterium]|nr:hypothetical protein [Actinomycetaceae bacterium]